VNGLSSVSNQEHDAEECDRDSGGRPTVDDGAPDQELDIEQAMAQLC